MSDILNTVTCAICDSTVSIINDGRLRYCSCRCLGVDSTEEYTKYIGTIPKEHQDYIKWYESNKSIITQARLAVGR